MYNMLTSFVIPIWWSIISGITGRFHRNMHYYHKRLPIYTLQSEDICQLKKKGLTPYKKTSCFLEKP